MPQGRKRLPQLFFPIFFEILFSMLTGVVDTLMLSSEGDQVVGAVGTANTYIGIFVIMFSIISSGMIAVMTQYIGAGQPGVAQKAMRLGLLFNLATGIVISCALFFFAEAILEGIGIAEQLLQPAKTYLQTVGLFCICNALVPIFSSYLRAFGHTAPTLTGTLLANVVNVILNAVFLFGLGWGVMGAALATGISRMVHLLWVSFIAHRRIPPVHEANPHANWDILRKIISVGLPAAMETSLYNMAITLVISLLNSMDSTGMQATARAYAVQISNFSFCAGAALAQANAITVGWHIGAGELQAGVFPAYFAVVYPEPGHDPSGEYSAGGGYCSGSRPHDQYGVRHRAENQRRRGIPHGHRRCFCLCMRRRRHLVLRHPPWMDGGGCLCRDGAG